MYRATFYDSDKKPICWYTDARKDIVEQRAAKMLDKIEQRRLVISYDIRWIPHS